MGIRRTITSIVSASAVALMCVPVAASAAPAPISVGATAHWYEGRTGTVKWAIGDEFLQQLTDAGATMSFCSAAKMSVVSGVNVATMPAHGNSPIQLNGSQSGVDAVSDCAVTITGNGATVELTSLYFTVASTYPSAINGTINGDYTDLATGAKKKLPKQATGGKIAVISPVLTTVPDFADVLRSGPVPTMTTDPVTLGLFQLVLKVKATSKPQDPHNSEG